MIYQPFDMLRVNAELLSKYQMPGFKFVDRGFKKNMLLVPGWATDWRIFVKLDIPFNYILPQNSSPGDFEEIIKSLPDRMKKSRISVLGWSMGGFIAADLVSRYPAIFDEVILVSIRKRYDKDRINHVRDCLRKNAKAYLYRFYGSLFSKTEKEHESWFKNSLLKEYLGNPDSLHLFDGLNYLVNRELKTNSLDGSKIIFVHGENDKIASLEEARLAAAKAPFAKFISIKGACHFPLLKEEFKDIFKLNVGTA
ncbi:MAG: alpha/beta fold hydrolase [Candidatus Omnitrophota bacterium]|nr:alpha/beta fold hydrolase [Candidatus Omnitrophota bacterium]